MKLREVLFGTSGLVLATLIVSVTPGLAQTSADQQTLSAEQQTQNLNQEQLQQLEPRQDRVLDQSNYQEQYDLSGQATGQSENANRPGVSEDEQAANGEQGFAANEQSQYSEERDQDRGQNEQQANEQDQYGGERSIEQDNDRNDRDQYGNEQARNGEFADRDNDNADQRPLGEGRDAENSQSSENDQDTDEDRTAANAGEYGQRDLDEQGQAAEADAYGNRGEDLNGSARAESGEALSGEEHAGNGEALEGREGGHENAEANENGSTGGGFEGQGLLPLSQFAQSNQEFGNLPVEDAGGRTVGHFRRLIHDEHGDQAEIQLDDTMRTLALSAQHFRFDPQRMILMADLDENQMEAQGAS